MATDTTNWLCLKFADTSGPLDKVCKDTYEMRTDHHLFGDVLVVDPKVMVDASSVFSGKRLTISIEDSVKYSVNTHVT